MGDEFAKGRQVQLSSHVHTAGYHIARPGAQIGGNIDRQRLAGRRSLAD